MTAHDVLHPVLELQLSLLEGDFFSLFGFGEVWLGGQLVQAMFQLVVLGGQLVKLFIALQQLLFDGFSGPAHAPPPSLGRVHCSCVGRR